MLNSIKSPLDLETTHNEKKLGFLGIALRKSKEAQHYVNLAEALKTNITNYQNVNDLLKIKELLVPLCEASGISTKARGYLNENELRELLKDFFAEFMDPLGSSYHDNLVSRYLLTLGDALGGRMRNIIGNIALGIYLMREIQTRMTPQYSVGGNTSSALENEAEATQGERQWMATRSTGSPTVHPAPSTNGLTPPTHGCRRIYSATVARRRPPCGGGSARRMPCLMSSPASLASTMPLPPLR
jgi:hypothetical protein